MTNQPQPQPHVVLRIAASGATARSRSSTPRRAAPEVVDVEDEALVKLEEDIEAGRPSNGAMGDGGKSHGMLEEFFGRFFVDM
eukprot:Skav220798  [mRNA]  locus=scaffold150:360980:362209:+ [translate_table: standard]